MVAEYKFTYEDDVEVTIFLNSPADTLIYHILDGQQAHDGQIEWSGSANYLEFYGKEVADIIYNINKRFDMQLKSKLEGKT